MVDGDDLFDLLILLSDFFLWLNHEYFSQVLSHTYTTKHALGKWR